MPVLGSLLLVGSLVLHLQGDPHAPTTDASNAPPGDLEIAGSPVLVPEPARPVPRPAPPFAPRPQLEEGRVGWGTLAITILAPSVFHVRAGESSRTGAGLAFLSLIGRGWSLPAPRSLGQMSRFGGAIAAVEGTLDKSANAFIWPLEAQLATGPRLPIGSSTFLYALVGFDGLLRMSGRNDAGAQRRRAYFHAPEISLGLQSKTRTTLWELGPLGGLALGGHDSVRFRSATPLVGPGTYTLRPYAGAQASLVTPVTTVTVNAHRTVVSSEGPAYDDRLLALVCHSFTEVRHSSGLGGCVSADIAHARAPEGPTLWSYELSFRVGGVIIGR